MDSLGNMLHMIKNAGNAGKESVLIPHSNFKFSVAQALLKTGYVAGVSRKGRGAKRIIEISLMYENGNSKVKGVRRLSKPSRRVYFNVGTIKPVRQGHGDLLLSTPKGVLTGREARKLRVGGEVLFTIW